MRARHGVRRVVAVAAMAAATAGAAMPAAAGAATAPQLVVEPSTGLLDDQHVTVTGSGFPAGVQVAVVQCDASDTTDAGCDFVTAKDGITDEDGTFRIVFEVERVVVRGNGTTIDCLTAPEGCAVVVFATAAPGERVAVPISFDPSEPRPHPLRVTVTVRRVGYVRTTGQAVLEGTISCNAEVRAAVQVVLVQDSPDVVGNGVAPVRTCGDDLRWRVVVLPEDGAVFTPHRAAATVRAAAFGDDGIGLDTEVAYVDLSR